MSNFIKYPKTLHLPWSESITNDDKVMKNLEGLINQRVIVTGKMDGENTTLYKDHMHARSLDSKHNFTRDWVKSFWTTFKSDIPDGWRICGENLWAKHSIHYTNLPSYFLGFSIWNDKNVCLSWEDTLEWFKILGITPVPVIFSGLYDSGLTDKLFKLWTEECFSDNQEGYVIRVSDAFPYADFSKKVAKFVRKDHIQTDEHWMHQEIIKNMLDNDSIPYINTSNSGIEQ